MWIRQGWVCLLVPSRCYFVLCISVNYSQVLLVVVVAHSNCTFNLEDSICVGLLQSLVLHSARLHGHFDLSLSDV